VKFGVLLDLALNKEDGLKGVEAGGQVVEDDLAGVGGNLRGVGVVGGEGVPVGDEEEAVVLGVVLQADPVMEGAHVVAEVQFAGGSHAAEDALTGSRSGVRHGILRLEDGFGYCTGGQRPAFVRKTGSIETPADTIYVNPS
jgi:hypothetical protein